MSTTGKSISLDVLFRQYHQELRHFAHKKLGCSFDAADIVQDAFVRYANMQQKKTQNTVIETPRFFLSRIVTNLIIDQVRRKQRRGIHNSIDDNGNNIFDNVVDTQPDLEQIIASRQQLKKLTSALNELPKKARLALLLNRVEGKTHQQIAEHMAISPSMVSKYIMQAVKHCAKRLN
jgi:RNA polymerase sigma-70 factor (ECF subfamily)